MNAIIIHGTYGCPEENWFPWLKSELEKLDFKVSVPRFPTPENQSLGTWKDVFEKYKEDLNKDTVLIGHSLGPAFILSILEELDRPVKASFFVAGFIGKLGNPEFDQINESFEKDFDWEKIKGNCAQFRIFYSDNDPYVPKEKAEELASHLNVKPILVEGAGHFNKAAGYTKFHEILKQVKQLEKSRVGPY